MEDKLYTVILSNDVRIENLRLNGNNFISDTPLTEEMFEGNLVPVRISDGVHVEYHEHMDLVQIVKQGNEYWFVLRDVPESELAIQKMNSNIMYLSMMTGIDLF